MRSILAIPDVHVPYHDKRAWALVLRVIKATQPDHVVIMGDFMDCYSVSSFPRDPARVSCLVSELHAANRELDKLQEIMAEQVTFLEGNHERRAARYIEQKAPELHGMVHLADLARDRRWRWVPYREHIIMGKLAFAHDIGHAGKGAVQQSLDAMGHNLVIGHTHRAGICYGGTVKGEHRVAMSCGWLGDVTKIDYMHRAKTRDWQHGFGWVRQAENGDSWLSFIPIIGGRCFLEGETYK
jgi:predicted phosphodiesterase